MRWQLLDVLSAEEQREFIAAARRRRFARNEVLFHEGEPGDSLHLIEKGHVVVRKSTRLGDVATLLVLGPGDCVGELALASPGPRAATVVALDALETLALHRDAFDALRARNVDVDRVLIEALVSETRRLSDALLEALYVPADKRVAARLVELASIFGDGSEPADIPVSQEELAQMAGVTRQTVSKTVRVGTEEGWLEVSRGHIKVLDTAAVERRAR